MILACTLSHLAVAATRDGPPPDREMLRMMELLRQMEMIKQVDMLREMDRLEAGTPPVNSSPATPPKKAEKPK